MATFQEQVQDLTSLTVSDTDELSQFLKDGVIDVTNRWVSIKPQDLEQFARESSEQTSNASLHLNGAKIISIIREDGTNNQWRKCRKISSSMQYDVTDTESLNYASKTNPAYMIGNNGQISVFPVPGADPNAFKAYYVNNDPEDKGGANLIHSHSDIGYFPDDKVYLVVMYAGIRLLNSTMSSNVISLTSAPPDTPILATVSFTAPTAPTVPSDPSISSPGVATIAKADISGDVPTYTKPSFSDPGALSITAVPPDTPDTPELSSVGTVPTYDNNIADSEFTDLAILIDTEEDVELAAAKIQEINAKIQNELNEFNEENIAFQAIIKKETQEDTLILQKYQADLAVYQAEVGAQVQEYTQKLQRGTQQYQLDMQNELNEFNKENARYQANIKAELAKFQADAAEALKEGDLTLQAAIQDYTQELALFSGEVQKYQSETQSGVQTMQGTIANNQALLAKYQAETAEYQAEIAAETQEQSIKMQQYQLLYKQLKAEYDQAFMIAAPKQQPKQQVRT